MDLLKSLKEAEPIFKPASKKELAKRRARGPEWKGIHHDYECRVCGKPATVNLQEMWHRWYITPEGEFVGEKEWEGDENDMYCDEHAQAEGII